jgi:hypothetical protein
MIALMYRVAEGITDDIVSEGFNTGAKDIDRIKKRRLIHAVESYLLGSSGRGAGMVMNSVQKPYALHRRGE